MKRSTSRRAKAGIQLQSELAEIFFRRWELWPLGKGPKPAPAESSTKCTKCTDLRYVALDAIVVLSMSVQIAICAVRLRCCFARFFAAILPRVQRTSCRPASPSSISRRRFRFA